MNPKALSLKVTIAEFIENYLSKYPAKLANLIICNSILIHIYILHNYNRNAMTLYNTRITPKLNVMVLLSECMKGGGRD